MDRVKHILIDGYYGFENLGDEAILRVILGDIAHAAPDAQVSVLSNNPDLTTRLHGVRAVNRLNPLDVIRAVSASDVVVIGGGGLFHEHYRWKLQGIMVSTVYSATAILAKAYQKPLYYYAIGLGPFYTPEGFLFGKFVLSLADFVSVRDRHSMEWAKALGKQEVAVTADPAFLLKPVMEADAGEKNIIFLSLREWVDEKLEQRLVREASSALEHILSTNEALRVVFLPFQTLAIEEHNDSHLLPKLQQRLPENMRGRVTISLIPDPQEMVNFLSKGRFMIGERLHAVILSVAAGIPFIALSYDRKVESVCHELGMEDFCLNIYQEFGEPLIEKAHLIEENREEITKRIDAGRAMVEERAMSNKEHFTRFLNAASPWELSTSGAENDFGGKLIKDLSKKIESQWDQIETLQAEMEEKDRRFVKMQEELAQKENELQEKERYAAGLHVRMRDAQTALDKIYGSDGWRLLTAYYRIRDKFFAPGSRPRLLARLLLSVIRRRRFVQEEDASVQAGSIAPAWQPALAHDIGFDADNPSDGFPSLSAIRNERAILVVDRSIPTYDQDSGSLRMYSILKILRGLDYTVTFLADDLVIREPYLRSLKAIGIEVVCGDVDVETYLRKKGGRFSYVMLSRPDEAYKYLPLVRAYAFNSVVIYDTVDLHWVRFERGAAVTHDVEQLEQARHYRKVEPANIACSDVVLAITEDEKKAILAEAPEAAVKIVPNIHEVVNNVRPFGKRKGLIFIGGFLHKPNEDAVVFFVEEILPLIRKILPDVTFVCVGSDPSERILALASDGITVTGYVPDVSPIFENSRVFVSPLRYGAGMKGKIGQSMGYGLPVVTTTIGAEGIGLVQKKLRSSPMTLEHLRKP
jgi:polysaccharide pyruvyl transferase CsaB